MLKINQKAPEFTLPNQDNKTINLKNFKGKWIIVYFYPKDNTPGCSIEAHEFSINKKKISELGAVILGISKDSIKSHCSFIEKKKLDITLLSDEDHKVQELYDVFKPKKFMGKEFLGTIRSTFLIKPDGKIAFIWNNVNFKGHVQEVLEKLKELNS